VRKRQKECVREGEEKKKMERVKRGQQERKRETKR
jgi:hypothetical protein